MHPDAILYAIFSKVIGLHFYCVFFSGFGMHVMRPLRCVVESSLSSKLKFIALMRYWPRSFLKNLKNSTVYPSDPGLLLFFIFLNTVPASS